jgi:hypothetical protein
VKLTIAPASEATLEEIAGWRYEPPCAGLELGRACFSPARARKVYEQAGFRLVGRHVRRFERFGEVEFVDMVEER